MMATSLDAPIERVHKPLAHHHSIMMRETPGNQATSMFQPRRALLPFARIDSETPHS
jgi:hypothetical protein